MKRMLMFIAFVLAIPLVTLANTEYEIIGQDTGTVQFDYENGGNLFTVIGSNGQTFHTMWTGCGSDSVYAYHDYVKLVSTEIPWESFPNDTADFVKLDWEQRAPVIHEGMSVLFMNEAGQFLACRVLSTKSIFYGDDEDLLTFEFKVYDADAAISAEILRIHEEKQADYVIQGKNEGTAQFDFQNNSGQFVIIGTNGQQFVTSWSGCGSDCLYAYQDTVKLVSAEVDWEVFPTNDNVFAELDWEQRSPTIHKGKFVVFLNRSSRTHLC